MKSTNDNYKQNTNNNNHNNHNSNHNQYIPNKNNLNKKRINNDRKAYLLTTKKIGNSKIQETTKDKFPNKKVLKNHQTPRHSNQHLKILIYQDSCLLRIIDLQSKTSKAKTQLKTIDLNNYRKYIYRDYIET